MDRRKFLRSLSRTALVLPFSDLLYIATPPWKRGLWAQEATQQQAPQKIGPIERSYDAKAAPPTQSGPKSPIEGTPLGISFTDVVQQAGLAVETIYGGVHHNKYLLETTGCGVAFYDYDNDGWVDVFLVNGWRLEGFSDAAAPRNLVKHLEQVPVDIAGKDDAWFQNQIRLAHRRTPCRKTNAIARDRDHRAWR